VLKAQAKDLPKKQADLARVATKIPDNPAMPSLIRALTSAATSAGVELVSVTPGAPAAVEAPSPSPGRAGAAAEGPAPDPRGPAAPAARRSCPAPRLPARRRMPRAGALATSREHQRVGGYFEVSQFLAELESLPRALRVTA
jgi:hypothetical protein